MFTWFDIIILTIIAASSIFGLYGGIIKLTIRFLAFIASIIFAYYLYPYSTEIIHPYIKNHIGLIISSGITSYIISLIICTFLSSKSLSALSIVSGGIVDRSLGLAVGAFRGIIICTIIFLTVAILFSGSYLQSKDLKEIINKTTNDKYPKWLKESVTTDYLDDLSKNIIKNIPDDMLELIKLPEKSEIVEITNVLEKSHYEKKSSDKPDELSDDFEQQLKEIIPIKDRE